MNCFSSHKRPMKVLIGLPLFLVVGSWLHLIQFHYPRAVENDPLLSPVKVQSVEGNTLVLADGRTYEVLACGEPLDKMIQASEFQIDIEPLGEQSEMMVYAKRRGWICGTPWVALIMIPLIPEDIPINNRAPIGMATMVAPYADKGP